MEGGAGDSMCDRTQQEDDPMGNDGPAEEDVQEFLKSVSEARLADAGLEEIEYDLGMILRDQLLKKLASRSQAPSWAQGDYGPRDLARRFFEFQRRAVYNELCEPDGSGLKPRYAKLLSSKSTTAAVIATLAATICAVLQKSASQVAVPAVGVYFALWLLRIDLEQVCKECTWLKQE